MYLYTTSLQQIRAGSVRNEQISIHPVPTAQTREQRQAKLDQFKQQKKRTYSQYGTAGRRLEAYIAEKGYDPTETKTFLNPDGSKKDNFMAFCEELAEYLDRQPDMTYSVMSNALSFVSRELNDQLYLAGKPSERYVRSITEVKRIEDKWKAIRFDPVFVTEHGELEYKDIQANLDDPLTMGQRLDGCRHLLNNTVDGLGILYHLNTQYEFTITHSVASRSEDIRAENLACGFVRRMPTIGSTGTDALFFMSNGGKTNQKGRLIYRGSICHRNPLLCPIAAKGRIFMMRWLPGGGENEPSPNFLKPDDYFLLRVCRPSLAQGKTRHDPVEYETQRKNFKALYGAIGYKGKMVTHVGRKQSQEEMTSEGVDRDTRLEFCRYLHSASDTSYNIMVPAKGLVNRAAFDHNDLRAYNCAWFIPTSEWPAGLEEVLIAEAAPWLPTEEAKVQAAAAECSSHDELKKQCLITAQGSLKAIRFATVVSLCNAAATPLGESYELLDEEPIYLQFGHPIFTCNVFGTQEFQQLVTMVKESQARAEKIRERPPTALTEERAMAILAQSESRIISAVLGGAAETASPTAATGVAPPSGSGTTTADAPGDTGTTAAAAAMDIDAPADAAATANANSTTREGTPRQINTRMSRIEQSAYYYLKETETRGRYYLQNENLKTIREIWTEYKYGWNGGPSLTQLNQTMPRWNKYPAAKTLYSKRKAIYETIEKRMVDGRTEDEVIEELQILLDNEEKSSRRKQPRIQQFNQKLRTMLKAQQNQGETAEDEHV